MSVTTKKKKANVRKETNAVSGTKPKIVARWMLPPRHAINRERRTRHGPELACVQTSLGFGVTSCRGTVQSVWQKPPVRRKEEEPGCPLPFTRPLAPECGDTLKALAGGRPGSLSTWSPAGRSPPHGDGSMCSQAVVRAGKSCGSQLERSRP